MADGIRPAGGPFIPLGEILLRTSRSSGPGGQHANVTASRVEAVFDIGASASLTEKQRGRLRRRFGERVTAVAQDARSQTRNRELALRRLEERMADAFRVRKARRGTRPSKAAKRRRLDSKRRRGEVKRYRRSPGHDE